MGKLKIGLQLYTVREELASDFVGTLRRVRGIGYTAVELAGHGDCSPADLKKLLDNEGLEVAVDHCRVEWIESDVGRIVDESLALGIRYVICPYLPEEWRQDEAGWRRCAKVLDSAGETMARQGLRFCYHNHSFEFVRLGGRTALDLLFEETDAAHVQAELDTYWVRHGGADPVETIRRLSGRCPIVHLKDMADDAERSFAEVGEGVLDFPAIFAAAERAGTIWGFVEQDTCKRDPFEAVKISLENLRAMGLA